MTEQQRERDIAEMEAQMAHDTDQYFEARPQIMRTRDKETTFEAGFKAAWAARPLSHAEGEAVDHWAVRNPGLADQFRAEAQAVRKRLGFESDADDVSPNDLRERIAEIEGAPQVAGLTETAIKSSPAYRALHREKEHLLGLLKDQAPQVAVPGGKRCACVFSEQGEPIQECLYHRYPAAHSAPQVAVPEGWRHALEEALAMMTSQSMTLERQADAVTGIRAMLAAAPTAPAGELVTRCTAGLGCDEKGYCDAAATGQGDLCDRRTMAHEQPVSDPDGLPDRVLMPRALTAENGAKTALSDEFFVDFGVRCARCGNPDFSLDLGQCAACQHTECEPNRRAVSWTTIKRIYSRAVEFLGVPAPDEREIAAKALSDFADRMGAKHGDTENGQFFIDCAEQAHEEAARLRAGKGDE